MASQDGSRPDGIRRAGPLDELADLVLPDAELVIAWEESRRLGFLGGLGAVRGHAAVEALLRAIVASPSFSPDAARAQPSLRLCLQWLDVVFDAEEMHPLLAAIYESPTVAHGLLAEEARAADGTWLRRARRDWCARLALAGPERVEVFPSASAAREERIESAPRVTVIIPSYEHEAFVERAIRSALEQSLGDLVVRVCDDASRDATAAVARSVRDPRVQVHESATNQGLGRVLAAALAEVETPFVAVLNSDDVFHPRRLERCLAVLDAEPPAGLVATGVVPIDVRDRLCRYADSSPVFDGRRIWDWLRWFEDCARFEHVPADLPVELMRRNFLISSSNLVGRAEALRATVDRWIDLEFSLDWQILLDAAVAGTLRVVAEPLLGYRLHGANTVWFDEARERRYYLENGFVAARILHELRAIAATDERLASLAERLEDAVPANRSLDVAAMRLGERLVELGVSPRGAEAGGAPEDVVARLREYRVPHRASRLTAAGSPAAGKVRSSVGHAAAGGAGGPPEVALRGQAVGEWLRRLESRGRIAAARLGHLLNCRRLASGRLLHPHRPRVLAATSGTFPVYSQTFVYQELLELARSGFDVRHTYSRLGGRDELDARFSPVWRDRCKLWVDPALQREHLAHYERRVPDRVGELVALVAGASGLGEREVRRHPHFREGFTFARLAEAWQADYLHSYFFYECSLQALVASHLLEIPRGVSCYADHLLNDYELKVVPLHLAQADIVVATSARVERELAQLAPDVDRGKLLVKPNAIDASYFPSVERTPPRRGEPYRLVCVARIEPKKGIVFLLEALRLLRQERGLNVELYLVGGAAPESLGDEAVQREITDFVTEHDLAPFCHLEGRRSQEEVRRRLLDGHVFVAPFIETESGDKDGIPTALLEAMSTGLPVVATDAGSMGEVVEPGEHGMLVAQRDAQALADAIAMLIGDETLRGRMGRAGARRVRSSFDVRVCESRLHERVASVIGAGTRGSSRSVRVV